MTDINARLAAATDLLTAFSARVRDWKRRHGEAKRIKDKRRRASALGLLELERLALAAEAANVKAAAREVTHGR